MPDHAHGIAGARVPQPRCDAPQRSRSGILMLLIAALAWPSLGAEHVTADDPAASAVLERFIVSQGEAVGWPVETIDIEASRPTLEKTGRLRAIRRLFSAGHPEYKVLEITGDATVKNQVTARYISDDQKAATFATSSVALTPTNYTIRYSGSLRLGDRLTYAYRMVPHKKREGLINGALWLDSETGIAVRESGYLAKSPSIFVKRINLTPGE
jgi:hypothetical protein